MAEAEEVAVPESELPVLESPESEFPLDDEVLEESVEPDGDAAEEVAVDELDESGSEAELPDPEAELLDSEAELPDPEDAALELEEESPLEPDVLDALLLAELAPVPAIQLR